MKLGVGLAAGVARQEAKLRVIAIALFSQLATACVVPGHMHVTEGIAPQNIDTNVRFRTTYYFRAFDYCWNADATLDNSLSYRKIIPETDTLYRYRMTGKASALGTQIKFESGVLPKAQIEPFGADVTYNSDIGGFLVRSPEAAKAQADAAASARAAAAASAAALAKFNLLRDLRATMKTDAEKATLDAPMASAIQAYLGTLRAPASDEVAKTIADLQQSVAALQARLATAGATPPAEALDALAKRLTTLEGQVASAKAAATYCSASEVRQHGFQIMGPEGMRPFDQDSRLIMAMHTSAKPLIETLNEYSSRLLKPRANPAEQLLPLARETTTIVQTQRALDRVTAKIAAGGDAKPKVDDVFAAAAEAFSPETK